MISLYKHIYRIIKKLLTPAVSNIIIYIQKFFEIKTEQIIHIQKFLIKVNHHNIKITINWIMIDQKITFNKHFHVMIIFCFIWMFFNLLHMILKTFMLTFYVTYCRILYIAIFHMTLIKIFLRIFHIIF